MKLLGFIILFSLSGLNQSVDWTIYYDKEHIPESLMKVLQVSFSKDKFNIANPDEKFNGTDAILDMTLPFKKLIFLANQDEDWRLLYKQGGFAAAKFLIQCKISENDSVYNFSISRVPFETETNDSVSKYIEEGRLKPQYVPVIYKSMDN